LRFWTTSKLEPEIPVILKKFGSASAKNSSEK